MSLAAYVPRDSAGSIRDFDFFLPRAAGLLTFLENFFFFFFLDCEIIILSIIENSLSLVHSSSYSDQSISVIGFGMIS